MNEDKATRYHRLRRRATLLSTLLGAAFLILFVITGASAWLRDAVVSQTTGTFLPLVAGYTVALALMWELIQLPLTFYEGVVLERRYGLSTQSTGRWWRDQIKSVGIGLLFGVLAAILVMGLVRLAPERWWVMAAVAFTGVLVVLAQLAPVLLLPLFYEFKPLQREGLVQRLMALADRAGTRVLGVFEWRLSDRTRKANAALAGLGRTRRILVSDTLLADHSDDEIEVILAHELAHHVHHDIWSAIAVEAMLTTAGFYAADRIVDRFAMSFGLTGPSDVAVLPLLLLAIAAVSIVLMPVFNAISRKHERRADRYALEATGNVGAFISAMKRLGAQNLAEERPPRLVEILFHSHPPVAARIEAARLWGARSGRA